MDYVIGNCFHIVIDHIRKTYNFLANKLSKKYITAYSGNKIVESLQGIIDLISKRIKRKNNAVNQQERKKIVKQRVEELEKEIENIKKTLSIVERSIYIGTNTLNTVESSIYMHTMFKNP